MIIFQVFQCPILLGDGLFKLEFLSKLLNMFHAPMGRFQLELVIFVTYFSTVVPLSTCAFFPVVLPLFVENVTLTTKGLQERKHIEWDDCAKIDNKNK